ncbi:helix-turn-helix domain-containing protein [Streptomyces sp. MP131-18]|uniref:helix-turn-helix transcriptional regulator n=1 Tax=Streptomyces sp. MP131-18 TaxID=1857892 RepID=UPI001C0E2C48|nr:helix-turn-helix domain-containing protein [Streptomyces sp. MP131-18]
MDEMWDFEALGNALRDARVASGRTQAELADAAGVSRGSVMNLEQGTPFRRVPTSLSKVAEALGWPHGRAMAFLGGRRPDRLPTALERQLRSTLLSLPLRVAHELSGGELVDTDVVDLSVYDPQTATHLVIVCKRYAEFSAGETGDSETDFAFWNYMQKAIHAAAEDWGAIRDADDAPAAFLTCSLDTWLFILGEVRKQIEWRMNPAFDRDGDLCEVTLSGRDLAAIVQAMRRLRRSGNAMEATMASLVYEAILDSLQQIQARDQPVHITIEERLLAR